MRRLILSISTALLLCGCGGGSASGGSPPSVSLDGTWAATEHVVGNSLKLTITTRMGVDTPNSLVVNGVGTYAYEAARSGTLSIYGSYQHSQVSFSLAYDSGDASSFSGTVTDATHISGKLVNKNGLSTDTTFVRQ